MPEKMRSKIIKCTQDFSTNILVDAATCIAINLLANYVYPLLLKMPIASRLSIGTLCFYCPLEAPTLSLPKRLRNIIRLLIKCILWCKSGRRLSVRMIFSLDLRFVDVKTKKY